MNTKQNRLFLKSVKGAAAICLAILFVALGFNLIWCGQAFGSNEETVVVVQPGDTLWSIAKENCPGKNIQEAIYQIQKTNGLKGANLQIGTVLKIPAF
ncbi:LysM peptidoglycan-binding domain-containing protein [Effusibacillus pohliae]|uniref:LysM peptidoglycan-binding domain-containing protein n=1 Tax=Effusibacillus pohliae TaxID=232270 RepID=UPI00035D47C1|nr:LysM peptidoglycan-binding domain-containing protein [Effusibacillus pohliae]